MLLGALVDEDGERVVAVANYVRLRDPKLAEAAFAVADEHQGRGIGTRLLEQLAERAAEVGIERFVAYVLPDNRAMLGVFGSAGFELTRELEGGEVEVQFPIARTESYREHVEARDHEAVVASLEPFFQPQSVAVIGASKRRGSIGGELFRNILDGDFAGAAYPVNRDGEPVAGVRGYGSIEEIPDAVDLAVITLPGAAVLGAAEQALRKGVRALVVISAGFAEIGSEGLERQEQLLALVRSYGARLIGPNCLGIAVAGPSLNATFAARSAPAGNIGFSSQSGALGLALLEAAASRGLGLSAFVSIGNKADVSTNDLLEWWEDDETTEVVLMYVESFGNPRRFGRLARRVARTKPILALKSGTTATGQKAASSHTAALAGSEVAVDALFHQAGVIRASSLEELIDVAALLANQPELNGRRVAVLTNAGGLGILCADACEAAGLDLPDLGEETRSALSELLSPEASVGNPVDMLGGATAETYASALPLLLEDPQVDAAIVLFVPTVTATADEVAEAIDRAATQAATEKPVLAVVLSAEGIPRGASPEGGTCRRFPLPRVGSAGARTPRPARRVAPPAVRHHPRRSRHRPRGCRARCRACARPGRRWLADPGRHARAPALLRPAARTRARSPAAPTTQSLRPRDARLPRRRQDRDSRCAQDGAGRHRARPPGRRRRASRGRPDRWAADRPADDRRRRGAAGRRRPGPGLRAARRLRPRRRLRRAHR